MMNHASCARQHWTQITTCDQTGGMNLSTHLDLCVSSVTQTISQNRLRIVTDQHTVTYGMHLFLMRTDYEAVETIKNVVYTIFVCSGADCAHRAKT